MFKRNQQKKKSKSVEKKDEKKGQRSENLFLSESVSPITTRQYNRSYNILNHCELKPEIEEDTIVLHRYELTYKEQEDSSSDPESYQKTTKYLAMNQFDRLVYKLSGNIIW